MVDTAKTFLGYERAGSRPGIRNHLLILNVTGLTDRAARRVQAGLNGSVCVSTHFGTGMIGPDAEMLQAGMTGLALNANCGAVLVMGANGPLIEAVSDGLAKAGKPFARADLEDAAHDVLNLTGLAIRRGAALLREISRQQRRRFPIGDLCVGLECGMSDPSSGLASNPLLGRAVDRLVDAGATAIMGETIEWLGAEDDLAKRAQAPATGRKIREAVHGLETDMLEMGVDLRGINPNAANIRAGLSTLEEKASGAVQKAGSRSIASLLDYCEAPQTAGLHLMKTVSSTPDSISGYVAAGAQMVLFTTGLGNAYVSEIAPTIKISANPRSARTLTEQIDFDASPVLDGRSPETLVDSLMADIVRTASGAMTWGEILGEGNECISRLGPSI